MIYEINVRLLQEDQTATCWKVSCNKTWQETL